MAPRRPTELDGNPLTGPYTVISLGTPALPHLLHAVALSAPAPLSLTISIRMLEQSLRPCPPAHRRLMVLGLAAAVRVLPTPLPPAALSPLAAIASSPPSDRFSVLTHIEVTRALLRDGEADGAVRMLCERLLPASYKDAVVAAAALDFASALPPSACATFFPAFLRLVAWHPSLNYLLLPIIPQCVTASTAAELMHAVLDLPLLTAALSLPAPTGNHERVLFQYILRHESGVRLHWNSEICGLLICPGPRKLLGLVYHAAYIRSGQHPCVWPAGRLRLRVRSKTP